MLDVPTTGFIRPTESEIILSWVAGKNSCPPLPSRGADARTTLEQIIAGPLSAGPTLIAFSGGRDSSALLAVAAHVARRDGFDEPIAVTAEYPGVPEADESAWQQMALDHLSIKQRIAVRITTQECVLSDVSRRSLVRHGLIWPSALHVQSPLLQRAAGGTLVTGEGGDEVIGSRRITPFSLGLHYRRPVSRALLAGMALSAAPTRLRRRQLRRSLERSALLPWITDPVARRWACGELAIDPAVKWGWARSTWDMSCHRAPATLVHNYRELGRREGVNVLHPFLEPAFLAALAHDGACWGYAGRTDLMRMLFADLLPDAVLARSTKASFNKARFGATERAFASAWDGSGFNDDLVDVEGLRRHWLSVEPSSTSGLLMQAAWLASVGRDHSGGLLR